jgi:quercetin dioxygenase-like cupin family protein
MKNIIHLLTGVLVATLGLVFATETVMAQDAVKVAPNVYKVLLENEQVRVLDVMAKPGEKIAMHSHPAYAVYMLSPGKVRFTLPDGKTMEAELKAGSASWHEAESHAAENVGTTEIRAVVVELKTSPAQDPLSVAPKSYKPLLGNERVRVLEVKARPGEKIPMHSHPANIVYSLSDSKVKFAHPDGKTIEADLKAGGVIWGEAVTHSSEIVGTTEAHVVVFELKD